MSERMSTRRKRAVLEKLAALSFRHVVKSTSATQTAARSSKKSSHWTKRIQEELRKWRRQRLA